MQPNRYNIKQKKITIAYIACIKEYTKLWIYTILEKNRSNLKTNY